MSPKIFVCQPVPEVALDRMREFAEVEVFPFSHRAVSVGELASAARRSDYIFCMHETIITKEVADANPKLKLGLGGRDYSAMIDVEACEAAGVKILQAKAPQPTADGGYDLETGFGLNARATSDLMVALLLNVAYRVLEADRFCRGTGYFQEMTMDFMGQGCTGKTVSLYGLGRVAREAVRKLVALDMKVLYNKRTRLSEAEEAELGVEWVGDTDELIARGDYVSMLANFEDANTMLMGEREFALMKPTAYFINVGRGRLIDEEALIRALQNGTIAGAGLEVFWNEPPVCVDPYIPEALRKMDNVVLTPHNGGATWDSRGAQTLAIANAIVDDIIASNA